MTWLHVQVDIAGLPLHATRLVLDCVGYTNGPEEGVAEARLYCRAALLGRLRLRPAAREGVEAQQGEGVLLRQPRALAALPELRHAVPICACTHSCG